MSPRQARRPIRDGLFCPLAGGAAASLIVIALFAQPGAPELRVLKMGLGTGTITSSPAGITCGADCTEAYATPVTVTLTATAAAGSTFAGWDVDPDADPTTTSDCAGTAPTCTLMMSATRAVRPAFRLTAPIPPLTDVTPAGPTGNGGIRRYLDDNPAVNSPARFLAALPEEYKLNWILMARSESLQTGIAELPRLLLPSVNAEAVFTVGMATHSSYPGAHPNAIEYMQWDAAQQNFRFHEIVLDAVPVMGSVPARTRGISVDDEKCSKCHSTRNVLNLDRSVMPPVPGPLPGTDGIVAGTVKVKNKPNWDTYDSWGGMLPFNRDRIYQGSVEAAAFRRLLNPWTWRTNDAVRTILEQLRLQPPNVLDKDAISRRRGGDHDGHVRFAFDASPTVLTEPPPSCSGPSCASPIDTAYSFDGLAGSGATTTVTRDGAYVLLRHTSDTMSTGEAVEGRAVQLFDLLGGGDGQLNALRIADELITHRVATGSVPIDVRPIALAIATPCVAIDEASNVVRSTTAAALTIDLAFFDARNGMRINELVNDTRTRAQSMPRRKADIQRFAHLRTNDLYLETGSTTSGVVQHYGGTTSAGTDPSMRRLRQEIFRRPIDLGQPDATVMDGIYVDRELHDINTPSIALYRYFLEPLGVSVDKWSMGVRGRSRTYTFADVFGSYQNTLIGQLTASLTSSPSPGLASPPVLDCDDLIAAVNATLASVPAADEVPRYTDVQRIFNKSCVECHGGLEYPPYSNYSSVLDLSENEHPPAGEGRLKRSHELVTADYTTSDPETSRLYTRITMPGEDCPYGAMPCGGPALSKADIETIRRWIVGGRPASYGDPHVTTVNGIEYDFQSAGEFVLLRDETLEIQARQTAVETDGPRAPNAHTGLASCVSVNSAVAMRIGNHRITYQPNISGTPDPEGLQLRVDGKLVSLGPQGVLLDSGGRIVRTTAQGGVRVEAPGGTVVILTPGWWDHHKLWYLSIDADHVRATDGVMGIVSRGQWLPALPDGRVLGARPRDLHARFVDLYETFEGAWRVSDATTLFDYAPGTSTRTFTIEGWPAENATSCTLPARPDGLPSTPPAKPLTLDAAQQHCSGVVAEQRRTNCIQDVMVTGEAGFAATYVRAEQIERDPIPNPPALLSPAPFTRGVDATAVHFTWSPTANANNDPLTYRLCVWDVRTRFTFNACSVVGAPTAIALLSERRDVRYALVWTVLIGVVLAIVFVRGWRRMPLLAALAIVAVAPLVFFTYVGLRAGPAMLSQRTAGLVAGRSYNWKVIAEDGNGASIESPTRRFEMR